MTEVGKIIKLSVVYGTYWKKGNHRYAVLRIRICMDPHDFGLLDPHPESAFQMPIPDGETDPG
jgi:hypothetical protein